MGHPDRPRLHPRIADRVSRVHAAAVALPRPGSRPPDGPMASRAMAACHPSCSGVVWTLPAERAVPPSEIATSQKSRWTSKPIDRIQPSLLSLTKLGDEAGERHLRIRARSPPGSVAGAASYTSGLSAQKSARLPNLRSPSEPLARDRRRYPDRRTPRPAPTPFSYRYSTSETRPMATTRSSARGAPTA
jgi:hypothetical protein